MTTSTLFQPTATAPFQFQATLDGSSYTVVVRWNVSGQRWYINILDQTGARVLTVPLLGSPPGLNISTASWDEGKVTLTTSAPHGFKLGQTLKLTVAGMTPALYDGLQTCLATGASTLTYPLPADTGTATILGTVGYLISMTAGMFASTLTFRWDTQTFAVSP